MTLSPNGMASQGHSRAHFRQFEQNVCRPKSIGWSVSSGMSVVSTTDLKRGPTNGLSTSSPMRLSSPRPAHRMSGICSTSLSALVCERAEKPSSRSSSAMMPAITAPRR